MTKYSISNQTSGADLGIYEADSPEAALDIMARDAGYKDYADCCSVVGGSADELIVIEVAAA